MGWPRSALILFAGLVAGGFVLFGNAPGAEAQDWKLGSSFSEQGLYNDNILLTPHNPIATFGSITTPQLTLTRDSPTSTLRLDGKFPFEAYFGHSDLNTADQLVNFSGSKDLSERSTLNLGADFRRDTNLSSHFDDTDRYVSEQIRRTELGVAPSWNYLLSPVDSLNWALNFNNVSYDSNQRIDYRTYGTGLSYSHQLSELANVTGSLNYTRFEPDIASNRRTNVFGGTVGYGYTPSERLTIKGAAGLSYDMTTEDGRPDDNGFGFILNFDFKYRVSDQTTARLSLNHDSEPSGDGRQTARDRAQLSLDYKFTELTTFGLDARYTDNADYLGTGVSNNSSNQHYFSVSPSVSYQITEDMSLAAQYQLQRKTSGRAGAAVSNAVFVTLRYALPDLTWGGM